MSTNTMFNTADIEAGHYDDRWAGYGYLGSRDAIADLDPALVIKADTYLCTMAEALGWDTETLFQFTNSSQGRHYGDLFAYGHGLAGRGTEDARSLLIGFTPEG